MDKNKSRTDLLAAGRKKLQQFRQKKDGKGSGSSHGKSLKKSSKSEQHESEADAASTAAAAIPESSLQAPEREISSHDDSSQGNVDLSVSHSTENSLAPGVDVAAADPLSVSITTETGVVETVAVHNSELPAQEVGVGEHEHEHEHGVDISDPNEGESTQIVDVEVARPEALGTSNVSDSEGETKIADTSDIVDVSATPASVDTTEGMAVAVETENVNREMEQELLPSQESLPSQENFPDTSLIQARGYQVTDVGAMQEADGLGLKQFDRSGGTELEGDGRFPLSELGDSFETLQRAASGGTGVDDANHEAEQTSEADGASASAGAINMSDGFSASSALALPEADGISAVSPDVTNHQREDVGADSSDVEKLEILSGSSDFGDDRKGGVRTETEDRTVAEGYTQQYLPEGSFVYEGRGNERPLETEIANTATELTVPPVGDGCSTSLLQLMELIRGLGEDEFRFLLKSRQSDYNAELGTGSLILPENGLPYLMEKLKEELYLTNCTKDIFHLQLTEQSDLQMEFDHQRHQLVDEIFVLRVSLNEVLGRNENLAEELANCRSELQAVTVGREELQNQFYTVKAEAEESSARAHELQISLEMLQGELSSLSMELTDCKDLVAVLQVENENLNGTIASMAEERKKLVEEKESCLHENEKLSSELADCKSLVAALQLESSNLSGTIASFTEERKKLEEEKESLAHVSEKLSTELADCKGFLAALQVESANLQGSLALVMEEKKNLEEGKENFVHENERLSSELLLLQGQLSTEHGERMQVEVNLKEVTVRLERLTEENIFLNGSLDIHNAKIRKIDNNEARIPSQVAEALNQNESSEVWGRGHENATFDERSHQTPGRRGGDVSSPGLEKPSYDAPRARLSPLEPLEQEVFDDSFRFVVLKGHLEEAEEILQNLEQEIEGIHSHSLSLSKSASKVAKPAVSKLIQAFESKVHHDEHEEEERSVTEDRSPADPFMLTKEQTGNLRAVLKQLAVDAENASVLFKGEQDGRESANVTFKELKVQYEALKDHSDDLEATNIELRVLYEAVKQHVSGLEAKNNELEVFCDALKQQDISLKAENSELGERLSQYQSRISELQSQLRDLHQSSDEMASVLHNQLESLQKEVAERALTLEQEWSSTVTQIVDTFGRLDEFIRRLSASTISTSSHNLDTNSRIAASVNAAIKVIEDLQQKLEAACTDHETVCSSYEEVNEKFSDLLRKNELAVDLLHKVYGDLRKLVIDLCGPLDEIEMNMQNEKLLDPVEDSQYKTLMKQLENFLAERLQLESVNSKLNLELMSRVKEIEEMNRRCLDLNAIQKLIEDVEGVVKLDDTEIKLDKTAGSHLESVVSLLVQKYKEAGEQVSSSRDELGSKVMELTEFQGKIHPLNALNLQHETEILALKESLSQAEEALTVARSELQEKVSELEQSEQRVSSIREKLSIAVAKGKGLVVQRDSLKQSLAETSSELERCSQELQLKDARLHEVETKLKTYSEAGERVEALESELSYIRNSATALRESFLLKDSVLQRIEEILEDLDLPEHFHSRDIFEKVDWLARSATGNSLPVTDWDQKSSVGGSYSDAGFVVMDGWKEDAHPSSNSGDDLRRKYEELQSKFYGLAEQNEMLEQSLMERNHLVQRWEELLDRINMPPHLRSLEPEDRIEWLGSSLSEANHERNSLQQKIDNLENYCGSLSADFEEYEKRISDLEADLQAVTHEREHLSERLEILTGDHKKLSATAVQFELDNEKLQNEVTGLQEKLNEKLGNEEQIQYIESEIRRWQGLVSDALQDPDTKELVSGGNSTECLERLLRKLIENYTTLLVVKPVPGDVVNGHHTEEADANLDESSRDILVTKEPDLAVLKKELEDALHDLMCVKEERDKYMEKQQSLISEVEALYKRREELQELLNQEEQKSASVREKLNVAVRKGKLLVQHRDSLKQTIEEMNTELERLKSEINQQEDVLAEYEQKIRDLSTYSEKVEALESESLFLRNRLTETERLSQEEGHNLSMILNTLGDIDVDGEVNTSDPVEKLERIGILFRDLHAAVASSKQESRKSKRAAELLLAELNEVQERNDSLQEELANAASELAECSKARDVAEVAKLEAFSHLEKLSTVRSEGKKKQYSEFMVLKSGVVQLRKGFSDINNILADVFSKDLENLQNLEANMEAFLKRRDATDMAGVPLFSASGGITSSYSENKENILSMDSWSDTTVPDHFDDDVIIEVCSFVGHHLQDIMTDIDSLKAKLRKHSISSHEQASSLFKVMQIFPREMTSQNESLEAMKRDIIRVQSIEKEKDMEIVVLRKNIGMLYEVCASSVMEIENRKAEVTGSNLVAGDSGMNLDQATLADGGQIHFSSEEYIKTMADRLLWVVKDFANLKAEIIEGNQKEMKITIANLQKELQEKDIQKDRICMELVRQIKEAEAAATSYSLDLQSSKTRMHDLEKRVQVLEEERNLLEQRVKELQDGQATTTELQDRVRSLTDVLTAKDQEIEALMQALEEEEVQMEDLTNKTEELEKVVQQKNLDLDNLEASRGKIAKKLSITVSKFDELHHLSESLLIEVEKLQSQLQDRDAEISFLRQEVTRCTNDVLVASQMRNKTGSDEIHEFLTWFESMISQVGVHDVDLDDARSSQVHEYKETLQKKIMSIISELEDIRDVAQSRDELLQVERSKVEEVTRRAETLEKFLQEKEYQVNMLEGARDSGRATSMTSEIVEVEPVMNKWAVPGTASQVRSLRKVNNDQVAIAIDMDPGSSNRLEDEDDDKVHGFKSLTTSRIVPKFTRPVTDMIDGLWVSCDRTLMRQPVLRLGIIIYWAILHALLATFVV